METIIGAKRGFENGSFAEAAFEHPYSICFDPRNPSNYWVGDMSSIRYVDSEAKTVRAIAGGAEFGCRDGMGSEARLYCAMSLLFVSGSAGSDGGGDRLLVTDFGNHRII